MFCFEYINLNIKQEETERGRIYGKSKKSCRKKIDVQSWKKDLPEFKEKTAAFYAGELSKGDYKGFSGFYGSYAQKGGAASMLRLRMTAGRVTKEKLAFTAKAVRKHKIEKIHFTTCQTIQLP